jgi:hypothetical protein
MGGLVAFIFFIMIFGVVDAIIELIEKKHIEKEKKEKNDNT